MATLISDERSLEQYIRDLVKTHQLTGNKFLEICAVPKLKKHCKRTGSFCQTKRTPLFF